MRKARETNMVLGSHCDAKKLQRFREVFMITGCQYCLGSSSGCQEACIVKETTKRSWSLFGELVSGSLFCELASWSLFGKLVPGNFFDNLGHEGIRRRRPILVPTCHASLGMPARSPRKLNDAKKLARSQEAGMMLRCSQGPGKLAWCKENIWRWLWASF